MGRGLHMPLLILAHASPDMPLVVCTCLSKLDKLDQVRHNNVILLFIESKFKEVHFEIQKSIKN